MSGLSPAARKELASLSPEERVEALRALVDRRELLRAAGLCGHLGPGQKGGLCLVPADWHERQRRGGMLSLHQNGYGYGWSDSDA